MSNLWIDPVRFVGLSDIWAHVDPWFVMIRALNLSQDALNFRATIFTAWWHWANTQGNFCGTTFAKENLHNIQNMTPRCFSRYKNLNLDTALSDTVNWVTRLTKIETILLNHEWWHPTDRWTLGDFPEFGITDIDKVWMIVRAFWKTKPYKTTKVKNVQSVRLRKCCQWVLGQKKTAKALDMLLFSETEKQQVN